MKKTGIILIMVVLMASAGCGRSEINREYGKIMSKATEERFTEKEIRDYQGVRLDPSIGPRDNSIKGIQRVEMENYTLKVKGLVEKETAFTYEEVLELPQIEKLITLYCVEGWDATILWRGVRITDLLAKAKLKPEGEILIFRCHDGYTTSMPLEEILDKDMILAFSSNGEVLSEPLGYPFIVVPEDKLGYKWARWLVEIEVSDEVDYEGTWEKRGYDNEAEIP
ncbi:molybdopterin-dependent oxidoreductase [Proteiniclasticum sp.]|uniref:molybdopterin-dependent oxidoreductase n=1 Tax=Proteiniclasticum sp. TaxID=2053595 RepID=UPI002899C141|nr:molybdopterin-dependent oxidoreductase [Proteiniclasticum sp.]